MEDEKKLIAKINALKKLFKKVESIDREIGKLVKPYGFLVFNIVHENDNRNILFCRFQGKDIFTPEEVIKYIKEQKA